MKQYNSSIEQLSMYNNIGAVAIVVFGLLAFMNEPPPGVHL